MIRTQIQLDEKQAKALRRLAAERGISMAALVREGVDKLLAETETDADWARALSAIGKHRGDPGPTARDHDLHLDEAFTT